ncbi:hypothetical protein ABZ016_24815 [Streptomyces sp. NPDC006372]|uniref:hypothetical protein n=1 Tax=Streptomyces sp. NPDC006372 TaxID=3155599 RepID=UPI0033AF0D02
MRAKTESGHTAAGEHRTGKRAGMTYQVMTEQAEARSALFDERYGQLVGYARRRLRDFDVPTSSADPEDVVTTAFIRVLARTEHGSQLMSASWLRRTTSTVSFTDPRMSSVLGAPLDPDLPTTQGRVSSVPD